MGTAAGRVVGGITAVGKGSKRVGNVLRVNKFSSF